jgi:hypothetical protein
VGQECDWIHFAEDKKDKQRVVNAGVNLHVLQKNGKFIY